MKTNDGYQMQLPGDQNINNDKYDFAIESEKNAMVLEWFTVVQQKTALARNVSNI